MEPSDFHVFETLNKHLSEKQSATDANVKHANKITNPVYVLRNAENLRLHCQSPSDDFDLASSKLESGLYHNTNLQDIAGPTHDA